MIGREAREKRQVDDEHDELPPGPPWKKMKDDCADQGEQEKREGRNVHCAAASVSRHLASALSCATIAVATDWPMIFDPAASG